jgi:hypothetical protein
MVYHITMKTIPVKRDTVVNGKVTETETVRWNILPPPASACQVCGHNPAHTPDQPHNAKSMYYLYAFFGEHGRWPTWKDAMGHCSPGVQRLWEEHLREEGAWTE